ncbi:bifunctional transaldolase [Ameyamaea chiangmaiensis NBRC 103196]|uniref:Transaldolase n=2 Tax=Ameyamaea chiangmaiensis TaxID=442969 RepID=A0A850P5G1_9PROT|nr:bifunctional transaldolase/phosoglucose isomerase [Ameyamaea chiangmaiensis]MBS4073826.1 bifunctional transaldolase/phosoglucose isomerase [Ameyamaea chiangmaiensis]NVN39178.1 bifunctional transaldolase/phosoglucose isomerase [Ameyamaea chiangmaiensis]GBQ68288.1 bifunctional transaldolase [Ameyamaea chiangmaiensis NBRC 103196]
MNVVHKTGASGVGNPLQQLAQYGQSPWLDFIQRSYTENGSLKKLVDEDGLKGVTSNPAIFEKAMGHGTDYDAQIKSLLASSILSPGELYETLAIDDIKAATKVLYPVYETTKGIDGYVSLEVSPYLAFDTEGTVEEARRLWKAVGAKNLMIKIPGTKQGAPAVRTVISEGLSINVTLLFALDAYKAVLEAYIAGLEDRLAKGEPVSGIASVASFFVSRIDGKIDGAIDKRVAAGDKDADALKALRGKVAIANAKVAYQHYLDVVASPRWKKLADAGAQPQRLLWASTGTKDKAYSDVLYVDELIGADTVNTIPPATFDAFRDHGTASETLTKDVDAARTVLAEAERLGLDLAGVTQTLVTEGCASFEDAFDALLGSVAAKQAALLGDTLISQTVDLPADIEAAYKAELDSWRKAGTVRKLWAKDASVWTGKDEGKWLKWLDIVEDRLGDLSALEAFQAEVKARGFTDVLLLGMGGSSLGPEVFSETFGQISGFPKLHVLDSTDPQQVVSYEKAVDLSKTLFIVSSKSGGTLEPNILKAYFYEAAKKVVGDKVGSHFVAVTDPGSHMEQVAKQDGFWKIFYGEKQIGGRYSVLSNFGIVPAAAAGYDVKGLLESAQYGVKASAASVPATLNPGVQLGAFMGVSATKFGRDKVTIIASHKIYDVGAWLEQLLAESTGKIGKGVIPFDGEKTGEPSVYGSDRVFAYLRLNADPCPKQEAHVKALIAAGQPVVTIGLSDEKQIAQVFFQWEIATAVAGSILGIDPFDQPDVEASKIETRKLTDAYNQTGSLPAESAFATDGNFAFFADAANQSTLKGGDTAAILKAHFDKVKAGDYVGILAYIERDQATRDWIHTLQTQIRDAKKVATAGQFGPRFLHSTGQDYKGGPNSGVFLQITADDIADVAVPGEKYTFGVVKAAQARGDFDVLAERGRRALRVHIKGDLKTGLDTLAKAILAAV